MPSALYVISLVDGRSCGIVCIYKTPNTQFTCSTNAAVTRYDESQWERKLYEKLKVKNVSFFSLLLSDVQCAVDRVQTHNGTCFGGSVSPHSIAGYCCLVVHVLIGKSDRTWLNFHIFTLSADHRRPLTIQRRMCSVGVDLIVHRMVLESWMFDLCIVCGARDASHVDRFALIVASIFHHNNTYLLRTY